MPKNRKARRSAAMRGTPRAGFSLIEIMMVVVIVGTLLSIAIPKFAAVGRATSVRASRDQVGAYLATAQAAAVRRGATAQFRRSGNSIYVTVSRTSTQLDTLLRPFPLDANQHVAFLTATSDSVLFNSRGTAQNLGISGAKFVMYREGIKDSVCVTKLGSILDRSCAL